MAARAEGAASGTRQHVVLVPGFGGFAALGAVPYFQGVVERLCPKSAQDAPLALCLHLYQPSPAARVQARSTQLGRWLAQQMGLGVIGEKDCVHIVAHSDGGLDVRQLLSSLHQASDSFPYWPSALRGGEMLQRIRSVQYLSTPHRGSNLARLLGQIDPLPQALLFGLGRWVKTFGPLGSSLLAQLVRAASFHPTIPGLGSALLDSLQTLYSNRSPVDRAASRQAYYALLQRLEELADQPSLLYDLVPGSRALRFSGLPNPSESEHQKELQLYERYPVRVRSLVTVSHQPSELSAVGLHSILCALCRWDPPSSLGSPALLRMLAQPEAQRIIGLHDTDGWVNSVSMIWPDDKRSFVVVADHLDVIGHWGGVYSKPGYDLFGSDSGFGKEQFESLWDDIRNFIVQTAAASS